MTREVPEFLLTWREGDTATITLREPKLERSAEWDAGELAETFPFAV